VYPATALHGVTTQNNIAVKGSKLAVNFMVTIRRWQVLVSTVLITASRLHTEELPPI